MGTCVGHVCIYCTQGEGLGGGVTTEPIKQPFAPEILDFLHPVHQAVIYPMAQHTGAAKDFTCREKGNGWKRWC